MEGKPAILPHLPSTSIIHLVKVGVCVCVFYYCNYDSVVFQLCLHPVVPLSIFI